MTKYLHVFIGEKTGARRPLLLDWRPGIRTRLYGDCLRLPTVIPSAACDVWQRLTTGYSVRGVHDIAVRISPADVVLQGENA